ncbi:interleukin-12 subunit alpha isoform X1 [Ornithorhynchus anatinus]|uniref:interleukin-12 subunit alpha isoform X1 n=1 Tax=Ornithorhynchus anatinus TaxID=9258 RepID=UPI0010A7DA81|nr:interleukin-12 subunit alpha isoform X1 [Ornithorhynchus anatinus]
MGPTPSFPGILFTAAIILLGQLSCLRTYPLNPQPNPRHPDVAKKLLGAISGTWQKASQILELYSCTPEEIDHEDITRNQINTMKACFLEELTKNGTCVKTEAYLNLSQRCLKSISEDLEKYKVEFKAINKTLSSDHRRQISLDHNMLAAIDELMQALNIPAPSETPDTLPTSTTSYRTDDFYKTKIKLCILLQAFRIRVVTINRLMNYQNSS